MKKLNVERIRDDEKCLAIYADAHLKFPDNNDKRKFNDPLSSLIEDWSYSKKDQTFNILLATLICKNEKDKRSDLENLLLYNLNCTMPLNCLMAKSKRIIFQCFEQKLSNKDDKFKYIYFYGLYNENDEDLNNYLLCNFTANSLIDPITIAIDKIKKLLCAPRDKEIKRELLTKLQKSEHNNSKGLIKIPKKTNYALKIQIPESLSKYVFSIEKLKTFLDSIIIYLNKLNILEHHNPDKLVTKNGQYNPSDSYLYFCEIEKVDLMDSYIRIFLCPIRSEHNKEKSCCTPKESLNNLLRFLGILGDKKKT